MGIIIPNHVRKCLNPTTSHWFMVDKWWLELHWSLMDVGWLVLIGSYLVDDQSWVLWVFLLVYHDQWSMIHLQLIASLIVTARINELSQLSKAPGIDYSDPLGSLEIYTIKPHPFPSGSPPGFSKPKVTLLDQAWGKQVSNALPAMSEPNVGCRLFSKLETVLFYGKLIIARYPPVDQSQPAMMANNVVLSMMTLTPTRLCEHKKLYGATISIFILLHFDTSNDSPKTQESRFQICKDPWQGPLQGAPMASRRTQQDHDSPWAQTMNHQSTGIQPRLNHHFFGSWLATIQHFSIILRCQPRATWMCGGG